MPQLTYMGFRYVEVRGIEPENIQLEAVAVYSDIERIGKFECSNELINKLQSCIEWGAKSNFVDIPTDCPQRDERLGWTADTAVFAATACFNFDMHDMYEKWLLSLRDDQGSKGQIPDIAPRVWMGNSRSAPVWADACAIVPWSSFMAYGDKATLEKQYDCICRYIEDGKTHLTDFVWDKGFQYGDWCAPGVNRPIWQERGKYVGTCYFANSVKIAARIAEILGKLDDKERYEQLFTDICSGFERRFVNADGSIKGEFQSAYVLPLYFGMLPQYHKAFAGNLYRLVRDADFHLTTGFAGTPYILFALADNGYLDAAYKVLLADTCPSWLYEIKAGATTMWERWDALRPDGSVAGANTMVSFNHYAYGAVGDFLYRRIAGIEATEAGYRKFNIAPKLGGGLTYAKAELNTPHGKIASSWQLDDNKFTLTVDTPPSTECTVTLPDTTTHNVAPGNHVFECVVK
jgi:alpha-L-rhamnosidase